MRQSENLPGEAARENLCQKKAPAGIAVKSQPSEAGPKNRPPKQNFTPRSVRRLEIIKATAPSLYKLFSRVATGKCSPRMAIRAQCLDCQGLDRQGVATCGDRCCPLWHFRPFRKRTAE